MNKPDQDRERERQDENVECRRYEFEAFHGRKHRYRRGDDTVAIEQRRSHDSEQDQNLDPRPVGYALGRDKRQQGQDAALAIVIGAQDEDDYLSETIAISAQKISDTTPATSAAFGGVWPVALSATEKV